jgi:outer membrane protein assembly factor BamB
MKFFQVGLFLFLLAAFGLFIYEEYKNYSFSSTSPDTIPRQDSELLKSHFTFNPFSNLDADFKWELLQYSKTKDPQFEGFNTQYSTDPDNILCFRGNNFRNTCSSGMINSVPTKLKLDWTFKTKRDTHKTTFGKWGGGTGWTGQALIVRWPKDMKEQLHMLDSNFINDPDSKEVIIGSLCGQVYFLNLDTGDSTRSPIILDGPIKGTPSIDPRLNGLLYVGQGIDIGKRFGSYIIDMKSSKVVFHQSGKDSDSFRKWGAFDSNPLIDSKSGNVYWPAENGLFYTFNSANPDRPKVISKLRYKRTKMPRYGMEASMAASGQYGFLADNSGNIMCVDLKNQVLIWNQTNFDDTDASLVLDQEKDGLFLYTGNEVDIRGSEEKAIFRKLDSKNGKEIWHIERICFGTPIAKKTNSGGMLATPLVGKKNAKNIVYCIFSRTDKRNRSELIAINKQTGKEIFQFTLDAYSWASPADFYDKNGNMYLFFTDVRGTMYLLDGMSGELIYKEKTKYVFESSPVIIGNRIVLGTRGSKILSFLIL